MRLQTCNTTRKASL